MSFSNSIKKVTDSLTKKFGDTIVLSTITQGAYDATTGETPKTSVNHTIKAVISDYVSSELVDGVIGIGDLKAMVYAKDFIIDKSWGVSYRGKQFNIMNVLLLSTQDENIYYELQLRNK